MNGEDDQQAAMILSTTLQAVAARGRARARRRVAAGTLVAVLAIGWGGSVLPDAGKTGAADEITPDRIVVADTVEEPLPWGGPWSLLLVATEDGMEMRAMSAEQIANLARKPGCEFAFTPEAVLLVSDYAGETEEIGFNGLF